MSRADERYRWLCPPDISAPEVTKNPAYSASKWGPGSQPRRTLATFLLWKVARPWRNPSSKTKRLARRRHIYWGVPPAGGLLCPRRQSNQNAAGCGSRAFSMRYPAAPGPPVYGGRTIGKAGCCFRRGGEGKALLSISLVRSALKNQRLHW